MSETLKPLGESKIGGTPRTDSVPFKDAEHYRAKCEQLERELNTEKQSLQFVVEDFRTVKEERDSLRAELKESDRDRVRLAALVSTERYRTQQWREMARELAVHCKLHEPIDYRITVTLARFAAMEKGAEKGIQ